MRVPFALYAFAAALILCGLPAHADMAIAAPATSTESQVWFGNALNVVLIACAGTVATILSKVLWMLAAKFGIQASVADQAKMDSEMKAALTFAAVKSTDLIKEKGWDHVDVQNKVLADGLNFVLERFPDRATQIATQVGAPDPSTASVEKDAAVTDSLMARLPDAMNEAAASPATPPVVVAVPAPLPPEPKP